MAGPETDFEGLMRQINELDSAGCGAEAAAMARKASEIALAAGREGLAFFFRGEALCLEGNLHAGAKLEQRGLALEPDSLLIMSNYATILSMLDRTREAIGILNRVLASDPEHLQALAQKGVSLSKRYRDRQALTCFDRILAIDPDNIHALRNKAVSLSKLGLEEEALQLFERVLRVNPADGHASSEKKNLLDEIDLRRTPLGWLIVWMRRTFAPFIFRLVHRFG